MRLFAKLLLLIFINASTAKCQNREVYLSRNYFEDGIQRNALFKLNGSGSNFVLIPCFSKGNKFNIDSIEYYGNMWPRIRVHEDIRLAIVLFKPVKKLIRYQQVLSKIKGCATNDRELIIYIKENNIVYTISIKDLENCLNRVYQKKAAKWVKILDQSIQVLNHYTPG